MRGAQMVGHGVGALVNCLIPADSIELAIEKLKQALHEDHYELVVTEFVKPYEGFKFELTADQELHDQLARQAAETDDVVYGEFYTWEREE